MTEHTFICTDCLKACKLSVDSNRKPNWCAFYAEHVNWRIESEDETRAREQAEALKYMKFDRPERKA